MRLLNPYISGIDVIWDFSLVTLTTTSEAADGLPTHFYRRTEEIFQLSELNIGQLLEKFFSINPECPPYRSVWNPLTPWKLSSSLKESLTQLCSTKRDSEQYHFHQPVISSPPSKKIGFWKRIL